MERLVSRNVTVNGHRTSLRLEIETWDALDEICRLEGLTIHQFCSRIEGQRNGLGRTSAVRVHIVNYFRNAAKLAHAASERADVALRTSTVVERDEDRPL